MGLVELRRLVASTTRSPLPGLDPLDEDLAEPRRSWLGRERTQLAGVDRSLSPRRSSSWDANTVSSPTRLPGIPPPNCVVPVCHRGPGIRPARNCRKAHERSPATWVVTGCDRLHSIPLRGRRRPSFGQALATSTGMSIRQPSRVGCSRVRRSSPPLLPWASNRKTHTSPWSETCSTTPVDCFRAKPAGDQPLPVPSLTSTSKL